eukprot:TRINITY_DN5178_c0_g1_i7.p2 TRINITY_DN5178_c0_g1~~TRINITY_DN5178_c0_g1_i7.p2  ORF type:complete len:103 (+),score=37.73 TRINITY_DN5178_c0_g1_i7:75-383(+)
MMSVNVFPRTLNVLLLTSTANHVFLLDQWWNAAVEEQAMDRVYRLGQTKPVFLARLIVKGTVEGKIVELQQRKLELVHGVLDRRTREQLQRLQLDDVKLLLS